MTDLCVIRLKPNQYIHVLDNNTNVTRLEVGPMTFTRKDHERVLFHPLPFINIPPRHYCRIKNPVIRGETGEVQTDVHEQVRLSIGDEEIRFAQDPFPLYPGEELVQEDGKKINQLKVIDKNTAILLKAIRDGNDGEKAFQAGDEWLFKGPGTYIPRVEVVEQARVNSVVVAVNEALRLRARQAFNDEGVEREVGEEWLVTKTGAYLPRVEEEIVGKVKARILTDKVALQLEATKTFTDVLGKERKAGTSWLVTKQHASTHIPNVHEKVIREVSITTLTNREWCIIADPVDANLHPQLGVKQIRKGEASFFLHPGEKLIGGIQDVIVLGQEEAILLRACEAFLDGETQRAPGELWMINGPCDYIPPVEVEIVERRTAMAMDENEGVYVRDVKTGKVRSVTGQSYMLSPTEELWQKELPQIVEELLQRSSGTKHSVKDGAQSLKPRDKTKVVRFSVQHNAVCQIYDYQARKPRLVFGPDLVMLGPDESFTVISLSGDKPKTPNVIKSLQLFLGPDFMTDVVVVETSDHARLSLKLSYNWSFKFEKQEASTLFSVPDFVGDSCKSIASRVRGAVASESFDSFHRNSARIIRCAVFGVDAEGKVNESYDFDSNKLTITNIDIQSIEPVDQKTRDALQKSVQMAIEITTKSQEASARHDAERKEQSAKGRLERQVIKDKAQAEASRKTFLQLQGETEEIEAAGTATAEATARAEATRIECQSELDQAKLKAQATQITTDAQLQQLRQKQTAEVEYQNKMNELEITKAKELAEIESKKFADTVESIGQGTLKAIAQAGPEMQAKLLEGLGLKGYLITDGSSPINLFNTAKGLVGNQIDQM